jgi:glutaminyl-peptide cyclotransferase
MVMDMIGDADLNILRDTNSTPWLLDLIYAAAEREGYQSHFYVLQGPMEDDHLPFVKRGVPCADVIDLDYGYNNVFHHTSARHHGQAQSEKPPNRRRHDPGNRSPARPALK